MQTKIQYKDYEPGEFTGIKDRSAEETIQLISTFPWNQQRDHLAIGLTNPSITIEGPNNDFLKLAPYYNGKFVLHYLDAQNHLYTRPFDDLTTALPVIQSFFDNPVFDAANFRKETTWLQNNSIHFHTAGFYYTLNFPRLAGAIATVSFLFIMAAVWSLCILQLTRFSPFFFLIPLALLVLSLRAIALFINHYRIARGKLLILSRGKDEFSYGPALAQTPLNKKDIVQITTYGRRGRGGYGVLTRVEIVFNDGRSIDIPCMIIDQVTLVQKFPHCPQAVIGKTFPFINPASSALFG